MAKDSVAFAHDAKYVAQVLYDSLDDLWQAVTVGTAGMSRP